METGLTEDSFAMEIFKAYALSTAATAGMLTGIALVFAVGGWLRNRTHQESTQEEN